MSRYNPSYSAEPMLAAAQRWANRCLVSDGSVFTDAGDLWTLARFDELDHVYVQTPLEEGNQSFFDKLKEQLDPATPDSRRLMAEVLWALMLFQRPMLPATKRENIRTVWSWSGTELDGQHEMLSDEVLRGVGATGTAYNTQRWREVSFSVALARLLKRRSKNERQSLLADPWQFAAWVSGIPGAQKRQFRHIIKYLLFPEQFERISTGRDKRLIVAAFTQTPNKEVAKWDDEHIDRTLLEVRQQLESTNDAKIDFYEGETAEKWREVSGIWLLNWNPNYWPWPTLREDRETTAGGQTVSHQWRCASLQPQEGDHAYLVRTGKPPKGVVALGTITKAPYEAPHFDQAKAQAGESAYFVDVAFSAVRDADRDPIVTLEELEQREPKQVWTPQASGIQIMPQPAKVVGSLWAALPAIKVKLPDRPSPIPPRNLILYGPPGTGKTYRLLTSYVPSYEDSSSGERVRRYEFVTFHQSYSYEDFVEGIRPKVEDRGSVTYEVKPGVFRRLCERAKKDQGHRFAIFIDEINRGNVAKILGELITLLEPDKRATYDSAGMLVSGPELTLPYSGERFGVPANLDLFGTMNTADRSIALLDVALRRRFEFEELVPTPGALTGADGNGLISDGSGGDIDLRRLLDRLNMRLAYLLHRDQTIGHAYLIKVKDFGTLRRVISREILPLLQEYFYEDWQRIRLALGDHPKLEAEHQLVRQTVVAPGELFPESGESLAEGVCYTVTPEADITPDAIRKIYEPYE